MRIVLKETVKKMRPLSLRRVHPPTEQTPQPNTPPISLQPREILKSASYKIFAKSKFT